MSGLLRILLTSIFFVFLHASSAGQNGGLSKSQDPADLPKSRTSVIHPKILTKISEETKLVRISDNEWIISGGGEQANVSYQLIYLTNTLPCCLASQEHYDRMCSTDKLPGALKITTEGLNVPLQNIITIK